MAESKGMPPLLNRTMKLLLRSPLHGIISRYITVISFRGCKSGKRYSTPVSYSQQGRQVRIFTHAAWWRNLAGGAPVTLRIRGRDRQGTAVPVTDRSVIAAALAGHLESNPFDARFYAVTMDAEGRPDPADVAKAVQTVVMVQVALNGSTLQQPGTAGESPS